MLRFDLFPEGKRKALTLSYDDGRVFDRRLVEIMNKYGIRGTFHLNTAYEKDDRYVRRSEYKSLYAGHEISCHGHVHPDYTNIPLSGIAGDLIENKRILEEEAGCPVRGMSYPYGRFNEKTVEILRGCGMEYSRTVSNTPEKGRFELPADFMRWNPTCKHHDCLKILPEFMDTHYKDRLTVFYVWGHSYEFDHDNNWELIETFCREASGQKDVWYAANIEIMDYQNAIRSLRVSANGGMYYNPSLTDIWATSPDGPVCIRSGEVWREPYPMHF